MARLPARQLHTEIQRLPTGEDSSRRSARSRAPSTAILSSRGSIYSSPSSTGKKERCSKGFLSYVQFRR